MLVSFLNAESLYCLHTIFNNKPRPKRHRSRYREGDWREGSNGRIMCLTRMVKLAWEGAPIGRRPLRRPRMRWRHNIKADLESPALMEDQQERR